MEPEEIKTDDLDVEKTEEITVEETEQEEVVSAEEADKTETEEEDPYEKELHRLDEEKKKAETIARQKTGALKEEREKRTKLEDRIAKLESQGGNVNEDALVERLRAEIKQDDEVKSLSSNPKEQQLIRELMKTKNLTPDEAWILANRHVVIEQKKREAETDQEEFALARLSGTSVGGNKDRMTPLMREAADGLTEKERKNLSFN